MIHVQLSNGAAQGVTDETNDQQLIRLASEREGRINDLTDRVSELERQLEREHIACVKAEADAHAARKAARKLRKVLKNAYLTALEAGK